MNHKPILYKNDSISPATVNNSLTFPASYPLPHQASDLSHNPYKLPAHDTAYPGTFLSPTSEFSTPGVRLIDLRRWTSEYLDDCELRLYSPRTIETHRVFLSNLLWFLEKQGDETCDVPQLRQFFHYLRHGHEAPGGRFGNKNLTRPARPVTVLDYYVCIRSLFDWLVAQGVLPTTPFNAIAKPQVREEVKTALSPEQITALIEATNVSAAPTRNAAIIALLLDTGCRASELVALRRQDVDLVNGRCRVLGKGDKYRTLFFGARTAELLAAYLREREEQVVVIATDAPMFLAARGGAALTRSGLLHLIKRLGKRAGIHDAACVHALRRTFAVQMLRNGANVFSVQAMLGHTNLQQTRKYCALALTDAEAQHRQFSPMDRLAPLPV